MTVTYYKRFRMEVDLDRVPDPGPLPDDFYGVPWHSAILIHHAEVKYRCFRDELDAKIFPCLGELYGCERLMRDISSRRGFLPNATWLIGAKDPSQFPSVSSGYVGTVQGVIDRGRTGMIQNLGIVPEARGRGLGTQLLLKALEGFREVGLRQGMLEVTAQNVDAVRLYRRLGFRKARTLYKAVEED
jgi:ribosomal protein S18 acetylase RimI-like enzyme